MKKFLQEILSESIGPELLQNLGPVGKAVALVTGGAQKEGGAKGQGSGGQGGGCGSGGKGRRGGGSGGGRGCRGTCGNQ